MWHFCRNDRTLGYGDGRKIVVGETLAVDVDPRLCRAGLHASPTVYDALIYAPGEILCEVRLANGVIRDGDKSVARERTVIRMADATDVLRKYARMCASDVLHLWDAPDVVKTYLRTGDARLREAARGAARDAVWEAARHAAWEAAREAQKARLARMVRTLDWQTNSG